MAVIKCRICGKDIRIPAGAVLGECNNCGTSQAFPRHSSDVKITTLYECAHQFWRDGEFDRASVLYKQILSNDNSDAEAFWSLALCDYGVRYVKDDQTHKYVPLVNSNPKLPFTKNDNYREALRCSDPEQGDFYEAQAELIMATYTPKRIAAPGAQIPAPQAGSLKVNNPKAGRLQLRLRKNDDSAATQASIPAPEPNSASEPALTVSPSPAPATSEEKHRLTALRGTNDDTTADSEQECQAKYLRAMSLFESRDLEKLQEARAIFKSLGDFLSAPVMVGRCQVAIREVGYDQAKFLYETRNLGDMEKALALFQQMGEYRDSVVMVGKCQEAIREISYKVAKNAFDNAKDVASFTNALKMLKKIGDFRDALKMAQRCEFFLLEANYVSAMATYEKAHNVDGWLKAMELFKQLGEFRDAPQMVGECQHHIESWDKEHQRQMRRWSTVTIIFILAILFSVCLALTWQPLLNMYTYRQGVKLMTQQNYAEALPLFTELKGYSDSVDKVKICQDALNAEVYAQAEKLLKQQDFKGAQKLFASLGDYRDSAVRKDFCVVDTIDNSYDKALAFMESGQYKEARELFASLGEFRDSMLQKQNCEYIIAKELLERGSYEEASKLLLALGDHKDSRELLGQCSVHILQRLLPTTKVGDTIAFGQYAQSSVQLLEPISWQVLQRDDDSVLLISQRALDCAVFHEDSASAVNWAQSGLRNWLNNDFLNSAFSRVEQGYIVNNHLTNPASHIGLHEVPGGPDTDDKVYLLSYNEVRKFFKVPRLRLCRLTSFAMARGTRVDQLHNGQCSWWLRSPGADTNTAARVDYDGSIGYDRVDITYGVRPVLRIACSTVGVKTAESQSADAENQEDIEAETITVADPKIEKAMDAH